MAILWLDVWATLRLVFSFSMYLLIALLKVTTHLPLEIPVTNIIVLSGTKERVERN